MKKQIICIGSVILLALASCTGGGKENAGGPDADSLLAAVRGIFQPLPEVAVNPDNPVTPEKVALGKHLYYDNRLSRNQTQSCNTCHDLATFGVDLKPTSPGDDGQNGTRNSPTTLNAALHFLQFWDGRMKDVEEQVRGPVMDPDEMNMISEGEVMARLGKVEGYRKLFAAAFPGQPQPLTFENMSKAIGAFERILITPGKFDRFLAGDANALDQGELKGLKTYMESGCAACHMGPLLGGNMFQKYPVFGTHAEWTGSTTDDKGRMEETKSEGDKYMFKVPSLRNVAETYPYFHDGSVPDLKKAVIVMAKAELNREITSAQVTDLVIFLKALTGTVPEDAKVKPDALSMENPKE